MSGIQFAMMSEWMPNGNIDQLAKARQITNRFELTFPPGFLTFSIIDDDAISIAGRRREGIGLCA